MEREAKRVNKRMPPLDARAEIVYDEELASECLEIQGSNLATSFVQLPDIGMCLGVPLRYLVLYLKNVNQFVSISADVVLSDGQTKTIVASNKQSVVRIRHDDLSTPLTLVEGWNVVVLDLAYIIAEAYNYVPPLATNNTNNSTTTNASTISPGGSSNLAAGNPPASMASPAVYQQCQRIRIHGGARIARVFFTDALRPVHALPEVLQLAHLSKLLAESKGSRDGVSKQ